MEREIIIAIASIIIGIITTHFYHRLQQRRRELCWSIDSTVLIKGYSSRFEKLDIQYGGAKIENLTVSEITFLNNGNETINRSDLAIRPYIYARTADTEILDARILVESSPGNRFRLEDLGRLPETNDWVIRMDFEYLDPQQGAVIQVIHTSVSVLPMLVSGEVKGVKEIEFKTRRQSLLSDVSRAVTYFYFLMMSVFAVGVTYFSTIQGFQIDDWNYWFIGATWAVLLIFVVVDIRRMRRTAKIPKHLSVFEKDDFGIRQRMEG